MIHVIAKQWAPLAFTVSFKLETDPDLLIPKSKTALRLYGHRLVVANLLKDRKRQVFLVSPEGDVKDISVSNDNIEIEELLVGELVAIHANQINTHV